MKILLCCPFTTIKTLGASKVYMEIGDAYRRLGHEVDIVDPDHVCAMDGINMLPNAEKIKVYPEKLKTYLIDQTPDYDIVEFEHYFLPYERQLFNKDCLMVARSILLTHHLNKIIFPHPKTLKGYLGHIFKGASRRKLVLELTDIANKTLRCADLINVTNQDDVNILLEYGHSPGKICHFPYGIHKEQLSKYNLDPHPPKEKIIGFIGTFDFRKGAGEFSNIFQEVLLRYPDAKLKLLGVKGLYTNEESILKNFKKYQHKNIQIHLTYNPEELPNLLSDVSVSIFPSHLESFGFGVLEMLAAGIPVIAYRAPGPPVMLPDENLVRPFDCKGMSHKIIDLFDCPETLKEERIRARKIAEDNKFNWDHIAEATISKYTEMIKSKN